MIKMICSRFKKIILFVILSVIFSTSFVWGVQEITKGEIISFFRDIHVSRDTTVRGDVVSIFGDINIQGEVQRDVVAVFGRVRIDGTVYRDVVSVFGGITVGEGGEVQRSATAVLGYGIINNGIIRGDEYSVLGIAPAGMAPLAMLISLFILLILIMQILGYIMSLVAVLIFPRQFNAMAAEMSIDAGKKGLIGLLVHVGIYVLATILAMTVIGIPVVIIIIPIAFLLAFVGNTVAKIAIGRKISKLLNKNWTVLMELLIGTLIYVLLKVTLIGGLVTLVLKFIGIGEVVSSRFGENQNKPPQVI